MLLCTLKSLFGATANLFYIASSADPFAQNSVFQSGSRSHSNGNRSLTQSTKDAEKTRTAHVSPLMINKMMSNVISRRLLTAKFIYPPPVEFSARFKPRAHPISPAFQFPLCAGGESRRLVSVLLSRSLNIFFYGCVVKYNMYKCIHGCTHKTSKHQQAFMFLMTQFHLTCIKGGNTFQNSLSAVTFFCDSIRDEEQQTLSTPQQHTPKGFLPCGTSGSRAKSQFSSG